MEAIQITITKHKRKIGTVSIARDKAFDMIKDLKINMQSIQEGITVHDANILKYRSNIALL